MLQYYWLQLPVVHEIPKLSESYPWKFAPFEQHLPTSPMPSHPGNQHSLFPQNYLFQTPCGSDIIQWFSFLVWPISLSVRPSRCIYVIPNGRIFFFLLAEQCSVMCIYHIFFTHAFVGEHLHCLHALVTVQNAVINMKVQVSFWHSIFTLKSDRI